MSVATSEFVLCCFVAVVFNMGLGTEVKLSFPLPYPGLDVLRPICIEQCGS